MRITLSLSLAAIFLGCTPTGDGNGADASSNGVDSGPVILLCEMAALDPLPWIQPTSIQGTRPPFRVGSRSDGRWTLLEHTSYLNGSGPIFMGRKDVFEFRGESWRWSTAFADAGTTVYAGSIITARPGFALLDSDCPIDSVVDYAFEFVDGGRLLLGSANGNETMIFEPAP